MIVLIENIMIINVSFVYHTGFSQIQHKSNSYPISEMFPTFSGYYHYVICWNSHEPRTSKDLRWYFCVCTCFQHVSCLSPWHVDKAAGKDQRVGWITPYDGRTGDILKFQSISSTTNFRDYPTMKWMSMQRCTPEDASSWNRGIWLMQEQTLDTRYLASLVIVVVLLQLKHVWLRALAVVSCFNHGFSLAEIPIEAGWFYWLLFPWKCTGMGYGSNIYPYTRGWPILHTHTPNFPWMFFWGGLEWTRVALVHLGNSPSILVEQNEQVGDILVG